MTDNQQSKPSAAPMLGLQAMNAAGAYSYGDKLGDAVAQIAAWVMAVHCNCVPPENVISAVHSLSVIAVIGLALIIQHKLLKNL